MLAVRLGKLTLVAEALGVQQPTVSCHLSHLEEELGERLFHGRSHNALTEFGRAFHRYAARMVATEEELGRVLLEQRTMGVAFISETSCREEVTAGSLIARPIPQFSFERKIFMVVRDDDQPSRAQRALERLIVRERHPTLTVSEADPTSGQDATGRRRHSRRRNGGAAENSTAARRY